MSYAEDMGFDAYWFCSECDKEEHYCKCDEYEQFDDDIEF